MDTPDTLDVSYCDLDEHLVERTLRMSYNRLRLCVGALANNPQNLELALLDVDVGNVIVASAMAQLTAADEEGKRKLVEFDLNTIEISTGEFDKILKWALAHVTDFFMKRVEHVGEISTEVAPRMVALKRSVDGLAASVGQTVSAGPSA